MGKIFIGSAISTAAFGFAAWLTTTKAIELDEANAPISDRLTQSVVGSWSAGFASLVATVVSGITLLVQRMAR